MIILRNNGSRIFLGRHLMVKGKYVKQILEGTKRATIRRGIVIPKYKEIVIHGAGRPIAKARIVRVTHKKLYELTDNDAEKDGFRDREELLRELKKVYPDIRDDEYVTIIEFKIVQRLDKISTEDPYYGLAPGDIARLGLRYLSSILTNNEKKILLDLTRTNSIRATASRLYGSINKRFIVRRVVRKVLNELMKKGILGIKNKGEEKY